MSVGRYVKKLLRHSAIYGVAEALGRMLGFVLIPFYTRALPQEAFGQLEVLLVFQTFGVMILSLGQVGALMRFFTRGESEFERQKAVAAATPIVLSSSIVFLGAFALLSPWLARTLFSDPELGILFIILSFGIVARVLTDVPLTLYRLREQSQSYATANFLRLALRLAAILVFVIGMGWGLKGVIVGESIGAILLFLYLIPTFVRGMKPFPRRSTIVAHLRFGLPLVLTNLGAFALLATDKLFLAGFGRVNEAAVYALGGKFFVLMNILIFAPFTLVWGPLMFRIPREQSDSEAKNIFAKLLTYFSILTISVCLALILFSKEILRLAAPSEYDAAITVVPILLVAALCLGLNKHFQAGLHITGNTGPLATSFLIGGTANVLGNFLLIPKLGIIGAAITSALSYIIMCVFLGRASRRHYPIPYEWKRLGGLLFYATLLAGTTLWWNQIDSIPIRLIGKGGTAVVFLATVWFGGFLSTSERAEALSILQRKTSVPTPVP